MQASRGSGVTPATITVTANIAGLPSGLTSGLVTITPANAQPLTVNAQINFAAFSIGAAGLMPTQLDGVSATVNGKPAYIYYISPTQINVLTPLDSALGTVGVQVTNGMGTSAVASVAMLENSLGFFCFNSDKYVAAEHADGSLLGPTTLYPGLTTPAKAGETVVLYGNGFGQTNPPITAGLAVQQGVLPVNPTVTIGGIAADVIYAGVVSPGPYQFNVVVPANAPAGDLPLLATYNGVSTQSGVFVTVGQ